MYFRIALVLASFSLISACATTPNGGVDSRTVASANSSLTLAPNAGGLALLKILLEAQPELDQSGGEIHIGKVACVDAFDMSHDRCSFFSIEPTTQASSVIDSNAEALKAMIDQWKKKMYPRDSLDDNEVKKIHCDLKGTCQIEIAGSGGAI